MAKPKPIGNILAELLARRGYGRLQAADACAAAWQQAAGAAWPPDRGPARFAAACWRCGCNNSTLVQELSFEKARLLNDLIELLPDEKIRDLKFRVGPID